MTRPTTVANVVKEAAGRLPGAGCDSLIAAMDDLGDALGLDVVPSARGAAFLASVARFDHSAMEGLGALVGDLRAMWDAEQDERLVELRGWMDEFAVWCNVVADHLGIEGVRR